MECQGKSECEEKTDYDNYHIKPKVGAQQTISLKNVSLKERHREARKPLFLARYE
jgi:hypothetical protein